MFTFANEVQAIVQRFNAAKHCDLSLHIGLADGEVDAGIVGRRRFVYEILGGCVTDARRLASTADGRGIAMSTGFESALGDTGRQGS